MDDVVVLVLFFPLFRILPPALTGRFRGALAALVVTTVLSRIADILPYPSPLQRIVLLGISVIALIVIVRLLGRNEPEPESTRRPSVLRARPIGWTALLALITSVATNILGDVSLTIVLATTVIMAAYLALLLYALYFIAIGVLWVGLGTDHARRLRIVRHHEDVVRLRILTILRIGFTVFWIIETTKFVHIFSPVEGSIRAVLTAKARFGEVGISLGDVLAFAVTIWAAFWVSRFLRFVLEEDVFPRLTLPRGVPQAISTGIHYAVLLFGFFLAVAATGIELSRFTLLAGAFGVGVGFGLQNVIHNFVSGLILLIERPIMPGDTIQMGDLTGEVKRIGMRSSTVRTWKGAEVIVPNGHLISNEVINWTLSDKQRRIEINVGVAYGTDPQTVVTLLQNVGASHPEVLKHPSPYVLFLGFGDSSLNFELRVWTVEFERFVRIQSEVTVAVEKALKEAGITIPFPQRDVHLIPPAQTPRPNARLGEDGAHPPAGEPRSDPGEDDPSAEASDPER
ncbi:MAG: mechanosensitive ion channel [bacterium]